MSTIRTRRAIAAFGLAVAAIAPAIAATPSQAATATTTKAATATAKVNANKATKAQLTAAFTAAGVSNASKWAKEVIEYRPYTADFNKLRQELNKYGIAPAQLNKIISVLTV